MLSWLSVLPRIGIPLWEEVRSHAEPPAEGDSCACLALVALRAMKAEGLLNERGNALLEPLEQHPHPVAS